MKKLNKLHLAKLKSGRERYLKSRSGLLCRVADGLAILTDEDNFVVRHGKRNAYFPTLVMALSEVHDILLKQSGLEDQKKSLASLMAVVVEVSEKIKNEIVPQLFEKLKKK